MANPLAPSAQWVEDGRQVTTQLARVYVIQSGTDVDTGGPVIVLDDEGPATYLLTHDSVNALILLDSSTSVPTNTELKIALDSTRTLLTYT